MTQPQRPLPYIEDEDREYWEAARRHELRMQRCTACGYIRFTPRPMCPRCQSWDFEWTRLSGRGRVYSWVVVHPPVLPYFADKTPYPVALIELEEGPRIVSTVVDVPADQLAMDLPVEVDFEPVNEEVTLPVFRRRTT
jgi:uncharacterized OB-fold protein